MNVPSRMWALGALLAGAYVDPGAARASSAAQALTDQAAHAGLLGETIDAVTATCGVSPSSIAS